MSTPPTDREPLLAWVEPHEVQRRLLRSARAVVCEALGVEPAPSDAAPPLAGSCHGLFVTLTVAGKLRGCIGTFAPTDDVEDMVRNMAQSALRDPRFQHCPVTMTDLPRLTIEISILSGPQPAADPLALVPGVHGIIIRRGTRSGCFLPRVPVDRGWTMEEALSQCCSMKAGLPANAWKTGEAEVWRFTAIAFSESDEPASAAP